MKEVKGLKPFGKFIMTIGQLPASYLVSMTYEEQLIWLCNYLQNTVIPTVNNNAEAVEELQNLFIELKSYVDDYFENLDVQEEINNKLDDMAESGELAELISQYLGLGVLFVYDTASDLGSAENLNEGASAYILGKDTYNDGKGAFYKIRELLNTDVPDGDNIITITNSDNLVGEKLPDYRMTQAENAINTINNTTIPGINSSISTINGKIADINELLEPKAYKNHKYLFIGDSYSVGYQGTGIPNIEGFTTKIINGLGLTGSIVHANGYGFLGIDNTHQWIDLLSAETISDKDTYTDVYILGGMNDRTGGSTLETAMSDLFTYINTNFPNAEIHVGFIGKYSTSAAQNLKDVRTMCHEYKKITVKYGNRFIDYSNLILHNLSYFISDGIHPNSNGQNQLAYGIEQYIINGEINDIGNVNDSLDYQADTLEPDSNVTLSSFEIYSGINKSVVDFYIGGNINFTNPITCNNLSDINVGQLTNSYLTAAPYGQGLNSLIEAYVYSTTQVGGSNFVKVTFRLYTDNNNNLHFKAFTVRTSGGLNNMTINQISLPYGLVHCQCSANM